MLPDCIAVALDTKGQALPFSMLKRDEMSLIVAPLSPHLALVGKATHEAQFPNDEELPGKLASCSHMFFVAASDNFRDCFVKIGETTKAEVDRVIVGVFEREQPLLVGAEAQPAQDQTFSLVTPPDFDELETALLKELVADAVSDVHALMPLRCLDQVVIANSGDIDEIGLFLVDPRAVQFFLEDGKITLKAFLPKSVGDVLVRESGENDFRLAFYALTTIMARVGAASRLDELSAAYFRDAGSEWHPAIHQWGVVSALPVYLSLNILRSAGPDKRLFELIDQAAANSFLASEVQVEAAKAAFVQDGDADKFAAILRDCTLMVVSAGAGIAGLGQSLKDSFPLFAQELEKRGLLSWFNRFARDLDRFWDEPRGVTDPRSWGLHSERVMLHWGVVSWPTDGGGFTIGMPPMELMGPIQQALKAAAETLNTKFSAKS